MALGACVTVLTHGGLVLRCLGLCSSYLAQPLTKGIIWESKPDDLPLDMRHAMDANKEVSVPPASHLHLLCAPWRGMQVGDVLLTYENEVILTNMHYGDKALPYVVPPCNVRIECPVSQVDKVGALLCIGPYFLSCRQQPSCLMCPRPLIRALNESTDWD